MPPLGPKDEILTVGDRLPPIAMPDPAGSLIDLSHQSLAGHTVVLWITGAAPDPVVAASVAAALRHLVDEETLVYAVTTGSALDGLSVLCDPEFRISAAVGLTGPGLLVLDPERRLVGVFYGPDGVTLALAAVKAIRDRTTDGIVQAQAPVIVLHDVADDALCKKLIRHWEGSEKLLDGVTGRAGIAREANREVKRRADVPILDQGLLAEVSQCITRRVAPAIRKAFQRNVTRCETPRVGCYDSTEQGAFGRHRDNTSPYSRHRLFALSLNLNDGYDGGEVRFPEFGRTLYKPACGDGVVFSCALLHEALPVLSGRRFGLFTFLYDEDGAAQERAMLAREEAAGRDPYVSYPIPHAGDHKP